MPVSADKTLEILFSNRLGELRAGAEDATNRISEVSRVIAYALVALIIPFVTADPDKVPLVVRHHPFLVLLASIFGAIALVSDLIQYGFAKRYALEEFNRVATNLVTNKLVVTRPADFMPLVPPQGMKKPLSKRIYDSAFPIKIFLVIIGCIFIFVALMLELSGTLVSAPSPPLQAPPATPSLAPPGQAPSAAARPAASPVPAQPPSPPALSTPSLPASPQTAAPVAPQGGAPAKHQP
jgi:hypothetical protein